MSNIICDKCGSGDVREYAKPKEKKPQPVYKMSEIAEGKRLVHSGAIMHAVMTYSIMVLECGNCGNKLEYTRNDQLGSIVPMYKAETGTPAGLQPLQVNPKSHNYQ